MNFKTTKITLSLTVLCVMFFAVSCKNDKKIVKEVEEAVEKAVTSVDVAAGVNLNSSAVPPGPAANASKSELYALAWEQFIALNWPVADPSVAGNRAKPSTDTAKNFLSVTNTNTPTLVWSTYASKAEVFGPKYQTTLPAWSTLSTPDYSYGVTPTAKATGDVYTLFNNLDENNEIGEATVFAGVKKGDTVGGSQVLYEAKMNEVEYSYIRKHNLQNDMTSATWTSKTKKDLAAYAGTCKTTQAATNENICFPCANTSESTEGVIEIKAAWRELEEGIDVKDRYYTKDVIVYEKGTGSNIVYTNKIYALIGLHIIRKTKNYPTFIFTTFGHVDNIKNGIYYNNDIAIPSSDKDKDKKYYQYYDKDGNPDVTSYPNHKYIKRGNIAVTSEDEIHTIVPDLQLFNSEIQKRIKTANSSSIWQYYELIGLQATPTDYTQRSTDDQYYLANNVIETDYTLRRFTGVFGNPTGIQLNINNVTLNDNGASKSVSMGGCMGCHGNAQQGGSDFSFLIGTSKTFKPDTVELPMDDATVKKVKDFAKTTH